MRLFSLLAYLATAEIIEYEQLDVSSMKTTRVRRDTVDAVESHSRARRAIFGLDERYPLNTSNTSAKFPFDTVVKINAGCTGILVSPKHVLTSAHCVHNGTTFYQALTNLRIGTLKIPKGSRLKAKKPKKKKNKKKKKKKRGVNARARRSTFEDSDQSLYDSIFTPYSKRTKVSRKSRRFKGKAGGDPKSRISQRRAKKSFKWTRAKQIMIPNEWKRAKNDTRPLDARNIEHDYAVIELAKDAGVDYMRFTISPDLTQFNGRIHFSSFDLPQYDKMSYRFCPINKQNLDLIFQKCDAEHGSSGAGIYVRYYVPEMKQWQRKIIGIFSGNVKSDKYGSDNMDFNVGVRITPRKYNHICLWIHGDMELCQKLLEEQKRRRPYLRHPQLQ